MTAIKIYSPDTASWTTLPYATIPGPQGNTGPHGNTGNTGLPGNVSLSNINVWTASQSGAVTPLTSSGGVINIDLSLTNNYSHVTTENTVLASPTNANTGQSGYIKFTQGTYANTLGFNTAWKFSYGLIPTLTLTIGANDILYYTVLSNTHINCTMNNDSK